MSRWWLANWQAEIATGTVIVWRIESSATERRRMVVSVAQRCDVKHVETCNVHYILTRDRCFPSRAALLWFEAREAKSAVTKAIAVYKRAKSNLEAELRRTLGAT